MLCCMTATVVAPTTEFDSLTEDIVSRMSRLLAVAHVSTDDVSVVVERRGADLHVDVVGPDLARPVRAALAVRVLDAVHAADATVGQVDVGYRAR
jgi:hypothetical protein